MNRGNQITKQEEQHRGAERRRTNTDAERKDEKNQRREEKPRDPKQATIFDFASCTDYF